MLLMPPDGIAPSQEQGVRELPSADVSPDSVVSLKRVGQDLEQYAVLAKANDGVTVRPVVSGIITAGLDAGEHQFGEARTVDERIVCIVSLAHSQIDLLRA